MSKSIEQDFKKQSYFRLLKYALKYKFRLAVGIIAGIICAGSMFSAFMWIPAITRGVEESGGKNKRIIAEEKYDSLVGQKLTSIKKTASKIGIELPMEFNRESKDLEFFSGAVIIPTEMPNGRMTWQLFAFSVFGFVSFWTLKNLATYVNRYYTRWVGTKVVADLRNKVFDKLTEQSLVFYGKMNIGQLISRCTNDTASIESAVANTIADATRCPLQILACIGYILMVSMKYDNWSLPIILFIGLPLCLLPLIILGKFIRKIYKSAFAKIADVISRMHEVFTGIILVKAYHTEAYERRRFRKTNRHYFRTVVRALKGELLMSPLMETVSVLITLVFLVYSFSQGVSLAQLAELLVPAFIAYEPIKKLAKIATYLQRSMAAADRYFDLLDNDTAIKEKENPEIIDNFKDKIVFDHLDFEFDPGQKILSDINLEIVKGDVVAVVGETGSGKTTMANMIARFYDATSGKLTIDGIDVKDVEIKSLRALIGVVTQQAILFNESIADNIRYGTEASMEEVEKAAKQANAHEFIVKGCHEDGYNTIVGEKGFKLSGGEKQRIAIARAILKNPPILILDEATSALDTVTEKLVQDALNHLMERRTVFAIAHRLSTIKHSDKILVLDHGKIIEQGKHDELMAHGKVYKKLYDTQFER